MAPRQRKKVLLRLADLIEHNLTELAVMVADQIASGILFCRARIAARARASSCTRR
jgi:hypothetical protein